MPSDTFHNIEVAFPFPLYDAQRCYLDKLLYALCNGRNALLESPTGTGKTLCLLCGVLAWQRAVAEGKAPHPSQLTHRYQNTPNEQTPFVSTAESAFRKERTKEAGQTTVSPWAFLETVSGGKASSDKELLPSKTATQSIVAMGRRLQPDGVRVRKRDTEFCSQTLGAVAAPVVSIPKVYYMSRTHSQLAQVVEELKRTDYVVRSAAPVNIVLTKNDDASGLTATQGDFFSGENSASTVTKEIAQSVPLGFQLKVTVLASRDHLCIHPGLSFLKGAALIAGCHQKLKHHTCHLEGGLSRFKSDALMVPRDIEELRNFGQRSGFCPYYAAKEHSSDCQLILLPYEYLLNPSMRKQLKFQLRDSVLIFDEGHNLERVAEDAGSFDLALSTLQLAIDCLMLFSSSQDAQGVENWTATDVTERLVMPLSHFAQYIQTIPLDAASSCGEERSKHEKKKTLPGEDLLVTLQRCGLYKESLSFYESVGSKCSEWMASDDGAQACEEELSSMASFKTHSKESEAALLGITVGTKAIDSVVAALATAFAASESQLLWYRVYLREIGSRHSAQSGAFGKQLSKAARPSKPETDRMLSFWCFNAGSILADLVSREKVHSVIVTSGTLAPLASYAGALNGNDNVLVWDTLENSHVVPKDRVCVQLISRFSDPGPPFRFVYKNKDNAYLYLALGHVVTDICRRVPGGVIVFFSSYAQLSSVMESWQSSEVWKCLNATREILAEPCSGTPEGFEAVLYQFRSCAAEDVSRGSRTGRLGQRKKSALLLAVVRGRISEGLNLSDDLCRCVIVAGVPYPAMTDPRLQLKQTVLDASSPGQRKSYEWYLQQAGRAVNQAIGRVIRHCHDFGVIVLIDERFSTAQQFSQLSRWVRQAAPLPSVCEKMDYSAVLNNIVSFFSRFSQSSKLSTTTKKLIAPPIPSPKLTTSADPTLLKAGGVCVRPRRSIKVRKPIPLLTVDKRLKQAASRPPISLPTLFSAPLELSVKMSQLLRQHTSGKLSETPSDMSSYSKDQVASLPSSTPNTTTVSFVCGICNVAHKESKEFQRSRRCGHRACRECWASALSETMMCPFCNQKTRKEHLEFFL